jgi:hypothetical protein
MLATNVCASEHVVAPVHGDSTQCTVGCQVVDLGEDVIAIVQTYLLLIEKTCYALAKRR